MGYAQPEEAGWGYLIFSSTERRKHRSLRLGFCLLRCSAARAHERQLWAVRDNDERGKQSDCCTMRTCP